MRQTSESVITICKFQGDFISKLMWDSAITPVCQEMGDEVLVWSKVWPQLGQTWPVAPCLSFPRTLGLHKLSLALVASTWHSLVSQKNMAFFLPGKPPCPCGWELFHKDVGLWQSWVSKLAPGVGCEGHKVASGEWQSFPSGTKDLLVLGEKCPLYGKKTEGQLVVVNGLERSSMKRPFLGKY